MYMLARLRQSIWAKQREVFNYFRASNKKRWQRRRMLAEPLEPRFLLSADLPVAVTPEFNQDPLLDVNVQALVAAQEVEVNIEEIAPEQTANDELFLDGTKSIVEPIATIENAEPVPLNGMEASLVLSQQLGTQVVIIDRGVEDIESLLQDILPETNDDFEIVIYEDEGSRLLNTDAQADSDTADSETQPDKINTKLQQTKLVSTPVTAEDKSSVDKDAEKKTAKQRIEIYYIDTDVDGIDRVSEILSQYDNLAAVHLLSHGNRGQLTLGNSTVTTKRLQESREQVAGWGESLRAGGDILLYGCDVADGDIGLEFIEQLSKITLADVAASIDDTGGTDAGGDWVLEASTGVIETSTLFANATDYEFTLAVLNLEGSANNDIFTYTGSSVSGTAGVTAAGSYAAGDLVKATGLAGDDTFKFTGLSNGATINIDGGNGADVLDFSAVNTELFFTVKDKGNVTIKDMDGNVLISAKNIESIIGSAAKDIFLLSSKSTLSGNLDGGNGDDTFIFGSGAELGGKLDGQQGTNTLAYSYKLNNGIPDVEVNFTLTDLFSKKGYGNVRVDLIAERATGINNFATNGFKNIDKVIGGLKKSKITGTPAGDTISGKIGDNTLKGFAGNDTITGGSKQDVIYGGADSDTLAGGKGNDIYVFEDNWGVDDRVIELDKAGNDTLNFATSTQDLDVVLGSNIVVTGDTIDQTTVIDDGRTASDVGGPLYIDNLVIPSLDTASSELDFAMRVADKFFKVNVASQNYQAIKSIAEAVEPAAPATPPTVEIESVVDVAYVADKLVIQHKKGKTLTVWLNGLDNSSETGKIIFLRDLVVPTSDNPSAAIEFNLRAGTSSFPVSVNVAAGFTDKASWLSAIEAAINTALSSNNGGAGSSELSSEIKAGYIGGNLNFSSRDGNRLTIWTDVDDNGFGEGGNIVFLRDVALPQKGIASDALNFKVQVGKVNLPFIVNVSSATYTGSSSQIKSAWLADIEQAIAAAMTGVNNTSADGTPVTVVEAQAVDIEQEIKDQWLADVKKAIQTAAKEAGLSDAAASALGVGIFEGRLAISDSNNGRIILWAQNPPATDPGDTVTVTQINQVTSDKNIEIIKGSKGVNLWKIQDSWNGDIFLDSRIGLVAGMGAVPTAVLDLSALSYTTKVTIEKDPKGTNGNVVTVELSNGSKVKLTNIASIKGGTGDNTYTFKDGARLTGTLDGGNGGNNTIAYEGKKKLEANLQKKIIPFVSGVVTNIQSLSGGKAGDILDGDAGANTLTGAKGADVLSGLDGADTIYGGGGKDTINGGNGDDILYGGAGIDTIQGGIGNDRLKGGSGADQLRGEAGDDIIEGGSGADIIYSDAGDDKLIGGNDSDSYIFENGWGNDTIIEDSYNSGQGALGFGGGGSEDTIDFNLVDTDLVYNFNKGGLLVGTGALKLTATNTALNVNQLNDNSITPSYAPSLTTTAYGDVGIEFTDADKNTLTINDRSEIEKIKTGQGRNTFLFGDDWGGKVVIDNTEAKADLFIDFRGSKNELVFTFDKDSQNRTILTIERVIRPFNDWMKKLPYVSAVDSVAKRTVDKITFIGINNRTEIRGGGNINTFVPKKGVEFTGEVHGTDGLRTSTFSNFLLGEPMFVVNNIDYSGSFDVDKVKLGSSQATDLTQAFDMNGVVFGSGANYMVGSSTFINSNGESASETEPGLLDKISPTELGIDTFSSAYGKPSISILAGMTGGDTYQFNQLWGFAAVLELPDIVVGNEAIPEFFDTLDFSGVVTEMEITVYDYSDDLRDWIDSLLPQNNDDDPDNDITLPGMGANIVVARDIGTTDTLNKLVGSDFLPGGLLDNTVVAFDIENIVAGAGKTTVKFVDGASIRGTLKGNEVILDYSEYYSPEEINAGKSINVDLTSSGVNFDFPKIDTPLGAYGPKPLIYGSAPGVEGNRFGGLTTFITGFLDVVGVDTSAIKDTLADFAVTNIAGVIGTAGNDTIKGGADNVIIEGFGGLDKIDGGGGSNTVSYKNNTAGINVDLQTKTGSDIDVLTNVDNIYLGSGNDTVNGSTEDNIFYFGDNWGTDVVYGNAGKNILDFSNLSNPSSLKWANNESDSGVIVLYTGDSLATATNKVTAYGDFKVVVAADSFFGTILKKKVELRPDSILSATAQPAVVNTTELLQTELDAVITEAKTRFIDASLTDANNVAVTNNLDLDNLAFTITDLAGLEMARTVIDYTDPANPVTTILIDATAAGSGWFTGISDSAFTADATDNKILQANTSGAAEGLQDLLTAVMHEMGHAIGLGHEQTSALSFMDDSLAVSTRLLPVPLAEIDGAQLSKSDQSLFEEGLGEFASWISDLGTKVNETFSDTLTLPFIDVSFADLFGIDADANQQLFDSVSNQVQAEVSNVFANATGAVTTGDLLLNNGTTRISATASSNLKEYQASITIADVTNGFALDFANSAFAEKFADLGLELDGLFELDVTAELNLDFIFGIDSSGEFYVEDPSLVAALAINHDQDGDGVNDPFTVGMSVGPLGLQIVDGNIDVGASMQFGTQGRISQTDMREKRTNAANFDLDLGADSYVDIELPVALSTSLAGVDAVVDGAVIRASNLITPDSGSIQGFLGGVEIETENFDNLLSFKGISLSDIINGLIMTIDELSDNKDADGDGDPDGLIFQKMPGINKSVVDLLGNGSTDVLTQIKNILVQVRDADNDDIQSIEASLNSEFNALFGTGTDPFSLIYEDSLITFDFALDMVYADAVAFDFDLQDYLPPAVTRFGDAVSLQADGEVDVSAFLAIDFGMGIDMGASLAGGLPVFIDDRSAIDAGLTIETLQPIDAQGAIDLSAAGLGEVGLSIIDGNVDVNVNASLGLAADEQDGRWNLNELNSSVLDFNIAGNASVDLPSFFPAADLPLFGTTQDLNGDGIGDNVIRLAAEFDEKGLTNVELPEIDLAGLFDVGALLNDPGLILAGLEGMFDGLKSSIDDKFNNLELPLVGDALKSTPDFINDLRASLLGIIDSNIGVDSFGLFAGASSAQGRYAAGSLGESLRSGSAAGASTIDIIKQALFEKLGDVLSVPVTELDPITGKQLNVYDTNGKLVTKKLNTDDPEGWKDIQLSIVGNNLQFNVVIADEVFPTQTVGLDFGTSLPGFDLNSDAGLEVSMDYVFGLGFGFGADGFYVDTTGISETGSEFALDLDAGLTGGIDANLFFFEASLADYTGTDRDGNVFGKGDDDGLSGFNGSFDIDLTDSNGDGKWVVAGTNTDSLSIEALLSAGMNVDLYAKASLPAIDLGALGLGEVILELPAIETVIRYDQVLAEATLGNNGINFDVGGDPELSFEDVTIDAGNFINNVLGPLIDPINTIIEPIQPLIDLLTQEISFLSTVGANNINTIQKMIEAIPDPRAQTLSRIIKAVVALSEVVGELSEFATIGKINLGDFDIDLGGDSAGSAGGSGGGTPEKATAQQTREDNSQKNKDAKQKRDNLKNKKSIKDAGDFQLTLLENPFSAVGLLLGQDDVTIFKYVFPDVDFNLDFGKTIPVFTGLNAGLFGAFSVNTDISIGFDSRGFSQFLEEDFADPLVLFNGFFLDDNFSNGVDMPELSFGATIGATASVGISGLVEAGVQGGVRGEMNFDFNDVIDDGKFYADEFLSRIIDPKCLFDINGSVSAFLDAFFWVGVDLGLFGEATLYEYRKNFVNEVLASFNYTCPPPETFDVASLDNNGNLNLRYEQNGNLNTTEQRNYSVEVVDEVNLGSLWRYASELAPDSSRDDINKLLLKDINGRDLTNLTGPQVIVKAGGVVEVFDADKVNSITASGSNGKDSFVLRGNLFDYINNIDINAAAGDDTINLVNAKGGQIAAITLRGGSGNDTILGSQFADTIFAGSGSDVIYGNDGDDTIYGVELNSAANGADSVDRLVGGAGNDTIISGSGNDIIYGDFENTADRDKSLTKNEGIDNILAGAGNDTVIAGAGADEVWGESGNDVLLGGDGNDILRGGTGNDSIYGEAGNDLVYGVTENSNANSVAFRSSDSLYGGAGDDTIYGGDGSDFISGGSTLAVGDKLFGDDGSDTFDWQVGDGLDFINGGKEGQTGISNTFNDKLVAQGYSRDSSGNILDNGSLDNVSVSSLGDDVRVDWQSSISGTTTLDLIGLRALSIDVGDGADTLRFNDLGNTTLANAASNGEIIPAVTVALGSKRTVTSQSKEARDANGNLTGEVNTFETLNKLDDNQNDRIEILGEAGSDEFILSSKVQLDAETGNDANILEVTQTGGIAFRLQEVSFNKDQLVIDAGDNDDVINASAIATDIFDDMRLLGGQGDDVLVGSQFSEMLLGGSGADRITGGYGVDVFQSNDYPADIAREYDSNGKVIIDTLVEQRDANFTVSDTRFEMSDSAVTEVEQLNNFFEAFEFTGGNSVNTFTLTNWSGNGFMNGQDGSDEYVVNLSQSAEGANFININDTGTDGKDSLNYYGSSEADLIQLDTVYQQTKDPERQFKNDRWLDYGNYGRRVDGSIGGDGLLIAQFGAALAGYTAKDIDDTDALFEVGVSSLLDNDTFQVLNYSTVEDVTVYGGLGDDVFVSDDTGATLNIYGNEGDDQFYIGSILEVEDVLVEGQEITVAIEVTQGTSYEMNIFGGDDDDYFEVSHNAADINLYGDNGDDTFFIKALLTIDEDGNTFDLVGKSTNVNAGKLKNDASDTREVDVDSLVYVENANVNIDGGAGFDSVAVVGTALSDTFYVWAEELANGDVAQRIFGAGIKLNQLINIERLVLLTGAGDDRVYINGVDLGPNSDMVVNLGSGSDEVFVGFDSFEFEVNFPKQNAIEYSTATGYERGQSYNTWGRTIYDVATSELIIPYTIRKPAQTEKRILPEMRSVDSIKSPLTIIGGLGKVDKITVNNEDGPQSLELSNTLLLKKQIETNDSVVSFPTTSAVTNGLTDLLNEGVADNEQVREILADFLRNQILFEDKYIDTNLVNELQTMAAGTSRDIILPEGISYAVFQDTLVPAPTADAPDAKRIQSAREQLDTFLAGTGFSANYSQYIIPGSEGKEIYYELTSISNAAGEQLAFESQNKTLVIDDVERRNLIGVSLLTASESVFNVAAGYIENVELADKTPTPLNTLSIENQTSNIFFEGFDEFDLNLNVNAQNSLFIDNTLFDGIITVEGGADNDTFTVYANNAQTFLNGNAGDDNYSIGNGTVDAITAELFMVGGEGNDSVVVNSEALQDDADALLEKSYLENTFSQTKLNKISSLIGLGDNNSNGITTAENELIVEKLRELTSSDINLLSAASFEQFELVVKLAGQAYASELRGLFKNAAATFEDDIDRLVEDTVNAYLSSVEIDISQYQTLVNRQSSMEALQLYREKLEALVASALSANSDKDSATVNLNNSLVAEYGANYTDIVTDIETLLANYLAADTLRGELRQNKIDGYNAELTNLMTDYDDASQAISDLLAEFAAEGSTFTDIVASLQNALDTRNNDKLAFDNQIGTLGSYLTTTVSNDVNNQVALYLANTDGTVLASSVKDVASLQSALASEKTDFENQLMLLADDYKAAADAAALDAALQAVNAHLATLGASLTTAASNDVKAQLDLYRANTDGSVTAASVKDVASLQDALAAKKLSFENTTTSLVSTYKLSNTTVSDLEQTYSGSSVGGVSLQEIITNLEARIASLESDQSTSKLALDTRLNQILGSLYDATISANFEAALSDFITGSGTVTTVLDTLNSAYATQAATYDSILAGLLDAYKEKSDAASRADLLVSKDGLTLAEIQAELLTVSTTDTELAQWLGSVRDNKLAMADAQSNLTSQDDFIVETQNNLVEYINTELAVTKVWSDYQAIVAQDGKSVADIVTELMTKIETDNKAELDKLAALGSLDNFESSLGGFVASYKAAVDTRTGIVEEIAAYSTSSSDVATLIISVQTAITEVTAKLLTNNNIDVEDYLASGQSLRDYLGNDNIGGVNSEVEAIASLIRPWFDSIMLGVEKLDYANQLLALADDYKLAIDENARDKALQALKDHLAILGSNLSAADQDALLAQLELYRADAIGSVSAESLLAIVQTSIDNAGFSVNDIASLNTAIQDFEDFINNIDESLSAEHDIIKSFALGLLPALDLDNIKNNLNDMLAVLSYQDIDLSTGESVFSIVDKINSSSSFAEVQALFTDSGLGGDRDKLLNLIVAYKDAQTLAKLHGLAKAQELTTLRDTLESMQRLNIYANFLPVSGVLEIKNIFDSYNKNLSDYDEIANNPARLDAIKTKAKAEALLASLEKDKLEVDLVIQDNRAFEVYYAKLNSYYFWYGYWTKYFLADSKAITDSARAKQAQLNAEIATQRTARDNAASLLNDTDAQLEAINKDLVGQYQMIKALGPIILDVLTATREGSELKALLDADSSLIATIQSYSNEYAVVQQAGDNVIQNPSFEGKGFSTVTSTVGSVNYDTRLLALTGLNVKGIYSDYDSIEDFTLNTGAGEDSVKVYDSLGQSTSSVRVNTGAGNDVVEIQNDSNNLEDIVANIYVDAQQGQNRFIVNDVTDSSADSGVITDNSITGFSVGDIYYAASNGNFSNGFEVTLGSGGNDVTVDSLLADSDAIVNTGSGSDTVTVSSVEDDVVDRIRSRLTLNGEGGIDTLTIDDSGDTIDNSGRATLDRITGLGMGNNALDKGVEYNSFDSLDVKLGLAADTFTIDFTKDATEIFNNGADINFLIDGGAGIDRFNVDDTDETRDTRMDLTNTTLNSEYLAGTITYAALENIYIETGSGNDLFNITSTAAIASTRVNTNLGNDQFNITRNGRLDGIEGELSVDGGSGDNQLNISDIDNTVGIGTLAAPATISRNRIEGFAAAAINYASTGGRFAGGVNIWTGSADDYFTIGSTRVDDVTSLWLNDGNDNVVINDDASGDDGLLVVFGEQGNDQIITSAWTSDMVLFGDEGVLGWDTALLSSYKGLEYTDKSPTQLASATTTNIDNGGDDTVSGGDGNDQLYGGQGKDSLSGGAGRDTLFGDGGKMYYLPGGQQVFESTNFFIGDDDFIDGGSGRDYLLGGEGNDTFVGNLGNDAIFGEFGRVTLTGTIADFVLRFGQGNLDVITSTMFALYLPVPLSVQLFDVGGLIPGLGGIIPTLAQANPASTNGAIVSHDNSPLSGAAEFEEIISEQPPAAPPEDDSSTQPPVEEPPVEEPEENIPVDVVPPDDKAAEQKRYKVIRDCVTEKGKTLNFGDVWSRLWEDEGYDKFVENIDVLIDVIRGKEVTLPDTKKCSETKIELDSQNTKNALLVPVAAAVSGWQVSKSSANRRNADKDVSIFAMLREKSKKSRFIRWD